MRSHPAGAFLLCALAIVACSTFGAELPVDADAGAEGGVPDGSPIGDGAPGGDTGDSQADAEVDGAPGDGGGCPHLRCLTFEEGLTGFDQKVGNPTRIVTGAPKGTAALTVSGSKAYVVLSTGDRAELWLSFYMIVGSAAGAAAPFTIRSSTGAPLAVGTLNGANMSVVTATGPSVLSNLVNAGATFRVGIHLRQSGAGAGLLVEGFFAVGDAAFGPARFSAEENTISAFPATIEVGSTASAALNGVFDDIFVSLFAMPAPSP